MAFIDGYEKVTPSGKPCPYSSPGTEKANEASAPASLGWAKRKKGNSDSGNSDSKSY